MHSIEVHKRIQWIVSMFYFIGLWHDHNRNKFRKGFLKIWHITVFGYYPVSLVGGAILSDNDTEPIFLGVMAIVTSVLIVRLYHFVLHMDEILFFIRMGVHKIKHRKEFNEVNNKINAFIKFVSSFQLMILCAVITMIIIALPIFSNEKRLPLNIYVPLKWKTNDIYYWLTYAFNSYEAFMTVACTFFNVLIWYMMMACMIQYQVLGNEFKNLGFDNKATLANRKNISVSERHNIFLKDLIQLIKRHQHLQKATERFKSFFSSQFFIQIATSALGICGAVYALAFSSVENPFQYGVYIATLLYMFFDIFIVTYFGNEIKLSSARLSYCLFESNWMDQSKSSKKCVIILMEVLKRSEQLVVGKLYPLDLEIFTKVLRLAYSMFNILKNVQ